MAKPQVKSGMTTLASNWIPNNPLTAFGVIAIGYGYQLFLAKTEVVHNVFADAEALRVVCVAIAVIISVSIFSRALKESVTIYTAAKYPPPPITPSVVELDEVTITPVAEP